MPDIELPSLEKQWPLYVFLQDVGLEGAIIMLLFGLKDAFDLVEIETYCDSITTIRVLPRLDDPSIKLMD